MTPDEHLTAAEDLLTKYRGYSTDDAVMLLQAAQTHIALAVARRSKWAPIPQGIPLYATAIMRGGEDRRRVYLVVGWNADFQSPYVVPINEDTDSEAGMLGTGEFSVRYWATIEEAQADV